VCAPLRVRSACGPGTVAVPSRARPPNGRPVAIRHVTTPSQNRERRAAPGQWPIPAMEGSAGHDQPLSRYAAAAAGPYSCAAGVSGHRANAIRRCHAIVRFAAAHVWRGRVSTPRPAPGSRTIAERAAGFGRTEIASARSLPRRRAPGRSPGADHSTRRSVFRALVESSLQSGLLRQPLAACLVRGTDGERGRGGVRQRAWRTRQRHLLPCGPVSLGPDANSRNPALPVRRERAPPP
jgi:hypothetical protein